MLTRRKDLTWGTKGLGLISLLLGANEKSSKNWASQEGRCSKVGRYKTDEEPITASFVKGTQGTKPREGEIEKTTTKLAETYGPSRNPNATINAVPVGERPILVGPGKGGKTRDGR